LLDDVPTPTRFVITPVVARLRGPLLMAPNAAEVASVFAAELAALRDPERYTSNGTRSFLGVTYEMHEYRWEPHRIWGATARMVYQLMALLRDER
ncbi:MAG TPA: CoA pyrophosphatase, partial [Polyangia bacterium]